MAKRRGLRGAKKRKNAHQPEKLAVFKPKPRRLPKSVAGRALMIPEILAPIIAHSTSKPDDKEILRAVEFGLRTRFMTPQETPWPFMLVCKAWNETVVSTPSLWSFFYTVVASGQYSGISHLPGMLDAYLRYSKDVPLTIWIFAEFKFYIDKAIEPLVLVAESIAQTHLHQRRWEDVRLHFSTCSDREVSRSFSNLTPTPDPVKLTLDFDKMKSLKKLDIEIKTSTLIGLFKSGRMVLGRCFNLSDLRWHGDMDMVVPCAMIERSSTQFPNLRSLDLAPRAPMMEKCWRFLGSLPDLVDLKLDFECDGNNFLRLQSTPQLSLPQLRSLSIDAKLVGLSLQTFSLMKVPSLEKLQLEVSFDEENLIRMAELLCHLHLSELHLKISISKEITSIQAVRTFVCSIHELVLLEIHYGRDEDTIKESAFRKFANLLSQCHPGPGEQDEPVFLPRLKDLSLAADPSDIMINRKGESVIKDIIFACKRRRPSKFRFALQCPFAMRGPGEQFREAALQSLRSDSGIRCCITDRFSVIVGHRIVDRATPSAKKNKARRENRKKRRVAEVQL